MRIYATAADEINNCPYDLLIPSYYQPKQLPEELQVFADLLMDSDSRSMCRTKLSVAHMVEMKSTKVPFEIIYDADVIKIMHSIDSYIEEVHLSALANPDIKTYLGKVALLRKDIERLFRRALNRHPSWKTAYNKRDGILAILDKLFGNDMAFVDQLSVPQDGNKPSNTRPKLDLRPLHEKLKGSVQYDV